MMANGADSHPSTHWQISPDIPSTLCPAPPFLEELEQHFTAWTTVRISLTMCLECTSPHCPCTHFHLSHPCFSLDAKHEPSSHSIYVAVPMQMGFCSIPFITLHTHPIEATHTKGEWLCIVHITHTHWPHTIIGKQDWME